MIPYQYAYLVGNLLLFFPVWLFFFVRRKDLRREILIISLFVGICGPLSELWYLRDYWRPETFNGWPIGIEDFLFGFFIGGIASSIYEEFFGKYTYKRIDRKYRWSWFIPPVVASSLFVFNILIFVFGVNSIYASTVTFLAFVAFVLYLRHDLAVDSLISGLLLGLLMFLGYLIFLPIFPEAIHRYWMLQNISGILIRGIPLEELLWAFGLGMAVGPMYEFFAGLKFKKK